MKLNECEKGESYHVRSILVAEAIGRRLEALGVNEKTQVTVLNKKKSGSVIIKVRGTRLALGRAIAEGIEVTAGHGRIGDGAGIRVGDGAGTRGGDGAGARIGEETGARVGDGAGTRIGHGAGARIAGAGRYTDGAPKKGR